MRARDNVVDEVLVLAAQAGQAEAFEQLARRWHPRLLRHALRLTSDPEGAREVVQEVWLAIARGLRRLHDPAAFGPWAFRIATRRCADWVALRCRARRRSANLECASEVAAPLETRPEALARVQDVYASNSSV